MPSWEEVQKEILSYESVNAFDFVRKNYLEKLHNKTNRNIICYYSGWMQKGGALGIADEDMNAFMTVVHRMDRSKGLDLILHTPGGSLVSTESLVNYLIKMFDKDIRAIVPQLSMSAGTMIACSCKEIVMGKESSLGPIDPQYNGIPAQGVVEEFEEAYRAISSNPSIFPLWQPILSKYNPSFVGECRKAIKLSEEMVSEWLHNNMFEKEKDREDKVKKIVSWLSSHGKSKTHARHFDLDVCQNNGLKIVKLEEDNDFQDLVLTLHHAYMHTFANTPAVKIVENHYGTRMVFQSRSPII